MFRISIICCHSGRSKQLHILEPLAALAAHGKGIPQAANQYPLSRPSFCMSHDSPQRSRVDYTDIQWDKVHPSISDRALPITSSSPCETESSSRTSGLRILPLSLPLFPSRTGPSSHSSRVVHETRNMRVPPLFDPRYNLRASSPRDK